MIAQVPAYFIASCLSTYVLPYFLGILSSKLKDANSEIASLKSANNIASTAVDTLRTQLNALVEEKRLANDEVKILKHKLKKYTNCKKETGGVLTDKENIVAK